MNGAIYLATPYIHDDKEICVKRCLEVTKAAAHFMDQGKVIYSPITHGDAINKHMTQQAGDHKFWLDQCLPHVVGASAIYVLGQEGWTISKGVRWEVETGLAFNIPVFLVSKHDYSLSPIIRYDACWAQAIKYDEDYSID